MPTQNAQRNCDIDRVEKTSKTLTERAGLAPFVAYLSSCNIAGLLAEQFNDLRKSSKGIALREAFRQLLCFFMDCTNLSLSHLDELAEDEGYRPRARLPRRICSAPVRQSDCWVNSTCPCLLSSAACSGAFSCGV